MAGNLGLARHVTHGRRLSGDDGEMVLLLMWRIRWSPAPPRCPEGGT
jgi:hypothetical protein